MITCTPHSLPTRPGLLIVITSDTTDRYLMIPARLSAAQFIILFASLLCCFILVAGCSGPGSGHDQDYPHVAVTCIQDGSNITLTVEGGDDLGDVEDLIVTIDDRTEHLDARKGSRGTYPITYPPGNCQVDVEAHAIFSNQSPYHDLSGFVVFQRYVSDRALCEYNRKNWRSDIPEITVGRVGSDLMVISHDAHIPLIPSTSQSNLTEKRNLSWIYSDRIRSPSSGTYPAARDQPAGRHSLSQSSRMATGRE